MEIVKELFSNPEEELLLREQDSLVSNSDKMTTSFDKVMRTLASEVDEQRRAYEKKWQ